MALVTVCVCVHAHVCVCTSVFSQEGGGVLTDRTNESQIHVKISINHALPWQMRCFKGWGWHVNKTPRSLWGFWHNKPRRGSEEDWHVRYLTSPVSPPKSCTWTHHEDYSWRSVHLYILHLCEITSRTTIQRLFVIIKKWETRTLWTVDIQIVVTIKAFLTPLSRIISTWNQEYVW